MLIPRVYIDLQKATEKPYEGKGRREGTPGHYEYFYDDEKGGESKAKPEEAESEFSLEGLKAAAVEGVDPAKNYHNALQKALETGEAQLQHPSMDAELTMRVRTTKKGSTIHLFDADGNPVKKANGKPQTFPNPARYEQWYVGTANSEELAGIDGEPWVVIKPNLSVSKGELKPAKDPYKRWVIEYDPSVPADKRPVELDRGRFGQSKTQQGAKDQVEAALRAMAGQDEPAKDESKYGSVSEKMNASVFPFKPDPNNPKSTVLNVSDDKRTQLITEASKEFWPALVRAANRLTGGTVFADKYEKDQALERLIGTEVDAVMQEPDPNKPGKKRPIFVALDPESPGYKGIEYALDHHDPKKGPFAPYVMNQIEQAMKRQMYGSSSKAGMLEESTHTQTGLTATRRKKGSDEESTYEVTQAVTDPHATFDLDSWSTDMNRVADHWEKVAPDLMPEQREFLRNIVDNVHQYTEPVEQQRAAQQVGQALLDMRLDELLANAVQQKAVKAIRFDKALSVLTKDKDVDPEHEYAYRDGDENLPRFYYTDVNDNQVRYTNAPTGHKDRSEYTGDAQLHPSEPEFTLNPEYFTPDGRKLTRAPDAQSIEWNERYDRYDPQNLWVGRWRTPDGTHQYTYVDSDIRKYPRLGLHQQNVLLDARLPNFRQYVSGLFQTGKLKDELTALACVLLDQGRMRAMELCSLTPNDVLIEGPLVSMGIRRVHADDKVRTALEILKQNKAGDEPLFAVPIQKDTSVDNANSRRIGPHYLARVLDQQGISLLALQTYHSTLAFVREVQRGLQQYGMPWEQAKSQAMLAVALEWGHDFSQEQDAPQVMQLIESVLVDPVVVDALQQNAKNVEGVEFAQVPPAAGVQIPHVSLDLVDRTPEEATFSQWLHSYPAHEHAGQGNFDQAA